MTMQRRRLVANLETIVLGGFSVTMGSVNWLVRAKSCFGRSPCLEWGGVVTQLYPDRTITCSYITKPKYPSTTLCFYVCCAMVCAACEKKLSKVACPDKWKEGARNTVASGGRVINENKALSKKGSWGVQFQKCGLCKVGVQQDYKFCQSCSYRAGLCAMCGKQVLDTAGYKQSTA